MICHKDSQSMYKYVTFVLYRYLILYKYLILYEHMQYKRYVSWKMAPLGIHPAEAGLLYGSTGKSTAVAAGAGEFMAALLEGTTLNT